jgi:hypothetical protein
MLQDFESRAMRRSCLVAIIVVGCQLLGPTACGGAARGGNGAQPVDAAPSEQNDAMAQGSNDAMVQDDTPSFVVRDVNYVSARWPGDVHAFAKTMAGVIAAQG